MTVSAVIERGFKLRFGMKLCLLATAGLVALTAFFYLSASGENLGDSYARAVWAIYDLKIRIFPLAFASFYTLAVLVAATASIAVISVLFSHKIAGPIYRLEKDIEAIAAGDLTVVTKFRDSDQLKVLSGEVNAMTRAVNHRVRTIDEAAGEVRLRVERLDRLLSEGMGKGGAMEEQVSALGRAVEELKKASSSVKVKG